MSVLSATLLLFLVMDPFGNLPFFAAMLDGVAPRRRWRVLLRELAIALAVLLAFLLIGRYAVNLLHISPAALSISGGVILFLVALRMVFPDSAAPGRAEAAREPFIVPMAVPMIAGPAAMALLLILASRHPARLPDWLLALCAAWAAMSVILMLSGAIHRLLGEKGVKALVRLMGMVLIVLAVQMFLNGVSAFMAAGQAEAGS
jgi:multiple antibiotic resistance protein